MAEISLDDDSLRERTACSAADTSFILFHSIRLRILHPRFSIYCDLG